MARGRGRRGGKRGGLRRRRGGGVRRKTDGGKVSMMRNTLVPDRMLMKFSYKDNINLSATSPQSWAVWNARANSLYDPDYAVVNGHQPLGYDQWSTFYNKYRVYKAIVTVTAINQSNAGCQVGVLPYNSDQGNLSLIDDAAFEQPHVVTKTVGSAQGMNKVVLKKVIDIPRILGQSHSQYKSKDSTQALFGANPLEVCNLGVFCRTINDSSAPVVQCIINIVMFAELFDRKKMTISFPEGKNPDSSFVDPAVPGTFYDYRGSTISFLQTIPYTYISTISTP